MNKTSWWLAAALVALVIGLPLLLAPMQLSLRLFELSMAEWQAFVGSPSLLQSIGYTLLLALIPTLLALYAALYFIAGRQRAPSWIAPLLAMPHVAFAVGISFLLVTDGWMQRLLPETVGLLDDKSMPLMLLVLWFKELPFLLLMSAVAMQQLPLQQWYVTGASLGYSRRQTFFSVVLPEILPRLRLPVFAVAVYAVSVVDVSSVVGPNLPAPLALRAFNWQQQFAEQSQAFALLAQWLLIALAGLSMVLLLLHERMLEFGARCNGRLGPRPKVTLIALLQRGMQYAARTVTVAVVVLTLLALIAMLLWSLAQSWPGGSIWPTAFTLEHWQWEGSYVLSALLSSLWLALMTATGALILVVIALELQVCADRYLPVWVPLLPILLPQLPLVIGWQTGISYFDLPVNAFWVVWAHILFAFAYSYLMLSREYLAFDARWLLVARSLQKSPLRAFFTVKLRMLFSPLLFAWAVAFSVSILQYVPTVLLGAGRVVTITTEATAYGSGFERSLAAVYALGQVLLPALIFAAAIVLNRRARREVSTC
ncbi:hypothetical protein ACR0ST_12810 [Aliidiomarina sp. Khilg15.8]